MSFTVERVEWNAAHEALADIRRQVFIEEQSVPEQLEWDGFDDGAEHVLARDDTGRPVGCARLLPGGRIGRMAVLPGWRGRGVGRALLESMIARCREHGLAEIHLSAQTHAIPFYEARGFEVCSETYDDASIPHQDMRLRL